MKVRKVNSLVSAAVTALVGGASLTGCPEDSGSKPPTGLSSDN